MTDQAFERAIVDQIQAMYRVCYAQLRSHADREDAVQEALNDLMLSLPEKLRITAVLIFMEGMTIAQAASVLRVPQGTVSSRIHKARHILKTQWEEANRE